MSEESIDKILESLETIGLDLKIFLNLFKLLNNDKISKIKQKILEHELRKKIYDLCDGTLTVNQIAEKFETKHQNITYHLGILTSAGLLSYREEGRERYYFKTLE